MRENRKILFAKAQIVILYVVLAAGFGFGQKRPTQPKSNEGRSSKEGLTPRQIVDRVLPSLVVVYAQDKQGKPMGQGSGFVFKPGLIATNVHVFKQASSGFIKVANSAKRYKIAAVVDMDLRHDICVVRIDDGTLPPLPLDTTNKLGVGDEVFAFGNPKGLEGSVSRGIISSIRNDLELIQIDAAISPGSSGGPIVNQHAQVIGIAVSALMSGQNLNFSVPIRYLSVLTERFSFPLAVAGALSVSDLEKEKMKGAVKGYSQEYADFNYDESTGKYSEESPKKMIASKSFDRFGNVVEEKSYHNGTFVRKYTHSYDDRGFMINRSYEDFEGERENWKPSINQIIDLKLTGMCLAGTSGDSTVAPIVCDNSGKMIENSVPVIGGLARWVSVYDENGFESETKQYRNEKLWRVHRYTYELDKHGNWIKRVLVVSFVDLPSLGGVPTSVTYRHITYYAN